MSVVNSEQNQQGVESVLLGQQEQSAERPAKDTHSPREMMVRMIHGFMISQAIYVAANLGLADLLRDGPLSSDELARASAMHEPSLYRVLRTLAAIGVFKETEPRVFALDELGESLQSDAEGSLRPLAVCLGGQCNWQAWGDIMHSVKTGESAFEHVFGVGFFQHLDRHPDAAKMFVEGMNCCSTLYSEAIAEAYDFSSLGTIVDVGGRYGNLITTILKANPDVRGILFDTPHLTVGAQRLLEQEGLTERCAVVRGDVLESVPEGGDAYLLKRVIREWSDERAIEILKHCRKQMKEDGRLLLMEEIMTSESGFSPAKVLDLQLLLMPGGHERTREEYARLLEAAGFKVSRIIPTQSDLSIIEATPA